MRILVTGASGFIGKNVLKDFPASNEIVALYHLSHDFPRFVNDLTAGNVIAVKVDLTDRESVAEFAKRYGGFDVCVFLAANGNPAASVESPGMDITANTLTLITLLENVSIRKLIYFSSGAVYDGITGAVDPASRISPRLPYAISKMASEHYLMHFQYRGVIEKFVSVRFFGAYGPFEPDRKIYTKLVKKFAIQKGRGFEVVGNGENLIDAMYVGDAVRAIYKLVLEDYDDLIIDLYSGEPFTINSLVRTAARIFGVEADLTNIGEVPEYIEFFSVDKTFEERFGFKPETSLEDGLQNLYSHLLN